ncbi:hypothetical protein Cgig2_000047 [Carnegiea gigantea]|uniref:Uncharacterized protein n=1 Tax=Carnegiea gigantea TaxID=171969 RepID=A0A9Q1QRB4_9CARY|nr:hypothetical protein Cgig2_000047 [Carnegiea gigantea]
MKNAVILLLTKKTIRKRRGKNKGTGRTFRASLDGLTPTCHRLKGRLPLRWLSFHPPAWPPSPLPIVRPSSSPPLAQPLPETGLQKSAPRATTPTTQRYSNEARSAGTALEIRSAQQLPQPRRAHSSSIGPENPSEEATGERQPHVGLTQSGRQRIQPSP